MPLNGIAVAGRATSNPVGTIEGTPPMISVIVLNWNGVKWLPRCIESLVASDYPWFELLVVDNGSTDESLSILARHAGVRVLALGKNLGYARANNLAAAEAKGSILLFLNNDTWVERRTLSAFAAEIERHREASIVAACICEYDSDKVMNNGILLDLFGYPVPYLMEEPAEGTLFYADGAALLIRAETFRGVGGFDEDHFIFAEDSDLCWRSALLGLSTIRSSGARVHHFGGGTVTYGGSQGGLTRRDFTTSKNRRYLTERNVLVNLLKNYSAPNLAWILPLFIALNLAEALLLTLRNRDVQILGVYLRSWAGAARRWPRTKSLRRWVQSSRTIPDRDIIRRMRFSHSKAEIVRRLGLPQVE